VAEECDSRVNLRIHLLIGRLGIVKEDHVVQTDADVAHQVDIQSEEEEAAVVVAIRAVAAVVTEEVKVGAVTDLEPIIGIKGPDLEIGELHGLDLELDQDPGKKESHAVDPKVGI